MAKISDYLTVGEAAEYLGVHPDSLRRWDRSGKLKARRNPITGFRLYTRDELGAILERASRPEATRARKRRRRATP